MLAYLLSLIGLDDRSSADTTSEGGRGEKELPTKDDKLEEAETKEGNPKQEDKNGHKKMPYNPRPNKRKPDSFNNTRWLKTPEGLAFLEMLRARLLWQYGETALSLQLDHALCMALLQKNWEAEAPVSGSAASTTLPSKHPGHLYLVRPVHGAQNCKAGPLSA